MARWQTIEREFTRNLGTSLTKNKTNGRDRCISKA